MKYRWKAWWIRPTAAAIFTISGIAGAQNPASDAQRRSEAANEPMQSGAAAQRDTAAICDAQTGWYADALKTRDERLAWWREARFGCFIHWGAYSVLGGEWQGKLIKNES